MGTRFDGLLKGQEDDKPEGHQSRDRRGFYMKDEKWMQFRLKALREGKTITTVLNEQVDKYLEEGND